jgi:hypothetical protein
MIASATDDIDNYGNLDLYIGNEGPPDDNSSFKGYILDFVWTNGVSKYNSNFYPKKIPSSITENTILSLTGESFGGSLGSTVINSNVLISENIPNGYNFSSYQFKPSPNVLSPPILTILNNGVLKTQKASPFKDSTSDGTSSFSSARQWYIRTLIKPLTPIENIYKKNFSGAKDAATVIETKRNNEIAIGSLNASSVNMSYKTTRDINVTNDALKRVRRGGSAVPAKVRFRGKNVGSVMNY